MGHAIRARSPVAGVTPQNSIKDKLYVQDVDKLRKHSINSTKLQRQTQSYSKCDRAIVPYEGLLAKPQTFAKKSNKTADLFRKLIEHFSGEQWIRHADRGQCPGHRSVTLDAPLFHSIVFLGM